MIIGIIGPLASGKETLARFIAKKYGYCMIDIRLVYELCESILDKVLDKDL